MVWVFNIYVFVEAIWLIIPAYAANGLVPLMGLKKNLHPIDFDKKFLGQPLFGKGKSWEGLFFGVLIGIIIATIEMLAFPYLPWGLSEIPLTIVVMMPLLGFLLGFGAMFGDLIGSFIKRRLGIPRGKSALLLDQLDFLLGALLFSSVIVSLKLEWIILLLIITPIFHLIANVIGYFLRVKKQPY